MTIIAKVSSYFPRAIRWRELFIDRLSDGSVCLAETFHSTINHTAECTPGVPIQATPEHTTPCNRCGGAPIGEGVKSRQTFYDDDLALLESVKPHRGLPLELAFLAASRDADFGQALIDYLDESVVPDAPTNNKE